MPAYSACWITFQTFAIDKSLLYYIQAKCEYVIAQSIFNPLSFRFGRQGVPRSEHCFILKKHLGPAGTLYWNIQMSGTTAGVAVWVCFHRFGRVWGDLVKNTAVPNLRFEPKQKSCLKWVCWSQERSGLDYYTFLIVSRQKSILQNYCT